MTEFTKRAWVHAHRPSDNLGRISCPCKQTPLSRYADGNEVHCPCGLVYDSQGYCLRQEEPSEAHNRG